MRKDQLTRLLTAAVALSAGLMIAGCECPHIAVLEADDKTLDIDAACDAMVAMRAGQDWTGGFNSSCADVCGDDKYNDCSLDQAYMDAWAQANPNAGSGIGGAGGGGAEPVICPTQGAVVNCRISEWRGQQHSGCPIPGRRPAGLANIHHDPAAVGRFLASSAYFEAAAVVAFERLAAELASLGAPEDLLSDLSRAARDEVRHASTMTRLAARHATPVPPLQLPPPSPRSIEEIALENAVEGLVNETFAAATALFQSENAADPHIRSAMRRIAADECAHAALAFRIATFLDPHLTPAARARIETRRREAIRALPASFNTPSPEVRRTLGVPTVAEAKAIHHRMCLTVWGITPAPTPHCTKTQSQTTEPAPTA